MLLSEKCFEKFESKEELAIMSGLFHGTKTAILASPLPHL